jgi:hypothetical protein
MSACESERQRREDCRAELREAVRALADGEVAGLELWKVSLVTMSLTVRREDGRTATIKNAGGLWRIEGERLGRDLMALVKGAADAPR